MVTPTSMLRLPQWDQHTLNSSIFMLEGRPIAWLGAPLGTPTACMPYAICQWPQASNHCPVGYPGPHQPSAYSRANNLNALSREHCLAAYLCPPLLWCRGSNSPWVTRWCYSHVAFIPQRRLHMSSRSSSLHEALLKAFSKRVSIQLPPDEHHAALVSLPVLPWLPGSSLEHSMHTLRTAYRVC